MKIQAHDAYFSFDNVQWVNAVLFEAIANHGLNNFHTPLWGVTGAVMGKFFRYQTVSLPTMLTIEAGSGIKMIDFVIDIDS